MRTALLSAMVLALTAVPATADDAAQAESAASETSIEVRAMRVDEPIVLDGVLTEHVWQNGNAVSEFIQRSPYEGAEPTQLTEVRVAYDDEALYVGARMHDTAPDSIIARLTRRDVGIPADRFTLYLDPYLDRRSGYYFMINAAGTLYDGTLFNDNWDDSSWDGVWEGKVSVDAEGWSAEMRIPYSQLRFQKAAEYKWGVNFRRGIQRHSEESYLVYSPSNESGFVSRFPSLVGIENVNPSRAIEILPYVTSKSEYLTHEVGDPFNDGSRHNGDVGADLRMAVGSRMTLNATVNPDFGQVEVDPAVVNLSDVESFFEEKRAFFVEGSSIFRFGNEGASDYWRFNWPEPLFFYSRRIGRSPQGEIPDADFVNAPNGTSILGATKLIGKLTPSVNFGTLHAVTDREMARLSTGSQRMEHEIEPLTYYGVMRAQKEFKDSRQGLGFITTVAARSFRPGGLRDQLNSESVVSGLDGWWFLDQDKTWVVSGWSAMTHNRGSQARITSLQESWRHYMQRPDAGHVNVDPNATSLTAFGSRYWINKEKGPVIVNAGLGFLEPGFDVADVGFQSQSDIVNGHFGYGYKWTDTNSWRKYQNLLGAAFASYDFGGNRTWSGVWASGFTEFINNYSWNYRGAYNPENVSNRRTRGGPLMITKPGVEAGTYFDTDGASNLFWFVDLGGYRSESNSWNYYFEPGFEWKPMSNLTFRAGPSIFRRFEDAQYVDTIDDATATTTFGQRYVFANLDQTTVSGNIRLNWAMTPTMSLQTFVQPLVSSGRYTEFKSLARPKSYEFDPYAYNDSPDFNFVSLRGSAVYRWEYMPGSTLFLVWTQDRSDVQERGEFNIGPDFDRLMKADADNIFLAKVTYYLNL